MQFFEATDGTRLAYCEHGNPNGVPILCLSGLTRTSADFGYIAPHLPDARLICMDYRGRGASQWTGSDTYSIPQEMKDALDLVDHLGIQRFGLLGTSRGGLIAMLMAQLAKDRLLGVCLNDIGPVVEIDGLKAIQGYIGVAPPARTLDEIADMLAVRKGFANVPRDRWLNEARVQWRELPDGVGISYDPALRESFMKVLATGTLPTMWELFDCLNGLPAAVIRGANSDLLSEATVAEMARRHDGLIVAEVPDRAHTPFLDETEAVGAILAWKDLILSCAPTTSTCSLTAGEKAP